MDKEQADKALLSEVEEIIDEAILARKEDKRKEMLRTLRVICEQAEPEFTEDKGSYALFLIQQVDIDQLDHSKVHKSPETEGMSIEEIKADGYYSGGIVSHPFIVDNLSDLLEILDSPSNALMTDVSMGKRNWASITRHKQNGALVYMLVAGGSVSTLTRTPSGEIMETHVDMSEEDMPSVLSSVCGECKSIMESQWNFTSSVQVLREEYPNSYEELSKELQQRMEGLGDEQ
jgi:hypothetical protein